MPWYLWVMLSTMLVQWAILWLQREAYQSSLAMYARELRQARRALEQARASDQADAPDAVFLAQMDAVFAEIARYHAVGEPRHAA